ncbi:MAG: efflux transporter outer membrane subunit [Deltaproteobacteria bacterium]|nr:efflux transporter outer membrane subunit [Deltaproteobacteria bacterium]
MRRLLIGMFLFSVGCSVGPDCQAPKSSMPSAWLEGWNFGVDAQPAELARWWTEFNDPILNSLVERAAQSNLDIFVAEARIREARAVLGVTESGGWPSVNTTSSYARSRTSANSFSSGGQSSGGSSFSSPNNLEHDLFKTGFDAGWEIDIFGATRRRVEAAAANLDAAQEDRRAVLVTLLGEVAKSYIDLRGLQRRLNVAQENLRAQRETSRLTKVRFEAGLANGLEVAQADGLAQSSEAQIPLLEATLKQTVYLLDLLLGAQPGLLWKELAADAPIPALPPEAHVGVPADLLRRRPDIRRAERQLAAATAQVGAATADLYPKFSLTGAFGLQSISASDWFTGPSRFWSIGPTITWPIFDAGKIRANIEIRNAQQEQAFGLYEKSVITALGEVESALVKYSKEQSRYRALLEAAAANRSAVRLANDLYKQGLVAFLNVLDAERTLFASESDLAQSEANLAANLVVLYKALGGGWNTN